MRRSSKYTTSPYRNLRRRARILQRVTGLLTERPPTKSIYRELLPAVQSHRPMSEAVIQTLTGTCCAGSSQEGLIEVTQKSGQILREESVKIDVVKKGTIENVEVECKNDGELSMFGEHVIFA